MALFRALESRLPPDRRLFEDPYAKEFLGSRLRAVSAAAGVPVTGGLVEEVIDRGWPGARVSVVVRTRFIDDALRAALGAGIRQLVVLGAGFDTRAYRIDEVTRGRAFEVDEPVTLEAKRSRIADLLGDAPAHVSFVAMDFERAELGSELTAAGFRGDEPAFLIWEGVTSYLTAAAVDRTLRAISGLAAPESRLAFTYLDRAPLEGRATAPGARAVSATVSRAGEPFRFGLDPRELPGYLAERGLELVDDATGAELAERYLRPLGRRGEGSPFFHVALAERATA